MLSYSDLYDILRKEKSGPVLQSLDKKFIADYSEYTSELAGKSANMDNLFADSAIKSKKQLENSVAIFRELMLIRKRKMLNLVFVAAETGIMKRDYENMINFERDVFDKLVKSFEEGDKELGKLIGGKKDKEKEKFRMIMFNQNVEQFVDLKGDVLGPFASGELANVNSDVAVILVSGGKAGFVDED